MITLPESFRDLEPFSKWAIRGVAARQQRCVAESYEEMSAFYEAISPRIEEIIAYLDSIPADGYSPGDESLADMALSLAYVAVPVELYGQTDIPFCALAQRMIHRPEVSSES